MATIKEYFQVAQREKATDIYFSVGSPPFLKINGVLKPLQKQKNLNKAKIAGLAREVLSSEKWSEFESRGELIDARTIKGLGRLRIVLANERKGPCMVCRLIPLNIPEFDSLGLPPPSHALGFSRHRPHIAHRLCGIRENNDAGITPKPYQ